MTIKPVGNNQKSCSKDDLSDDQNAQGGGTNSPKREKRKNVGVVFEDGRHRRSQPKSCCRLKRDHQKRLEVRSSIEREKHSNGQYSNLCGLAAGGPAVNASNNIVAGASANVIGSPSTGTACPVGGQNQVPELLDEAYSGYNSGDEHRSRDAGLTPSEWKERDETFNRTMSERGLIIKEIEEDGACLFRAISLQIYGDQDMHEDIRQQTMDYVAQNQEYFAQFVTEDIKSYISRKRNSHVHGNHIEIQAMSEIYNRPVELYCYQTKPINIFNSEQRDNGYEPLRLSYQRGSHYNAILDPYKASVGVGLGLAGYKPDELDLKEITEAVRMSEEHQIEQTMFEDKLKTTDWEATNEAIEEQIARESYLQWCRENMQRACKKPVSSTVTSSTVTAGGQPGGSGTSGSNSSLSGSPTTNNSNSNAVGATTVSTPGTVVPSSGPTGTMPVGRMSPKERTYPSAEADNSRIGGSSSASSASSSASSYYDQTSSSSQYSDTNGFMLVNCAGIGVQGRQQRRRRRHHHPRATASQAKPATPLSVSPLELNGLNLAECRSTDSNDSDLSDATISKKLKRRLNASTCELSPATDQGEVEAGGSDEVRQTSEGGEPSQVMEPGPSSRAGTAEGQGGAMLDAGDLLADSTNFYHSLLESSYKDDGAAQMTETEMIQRAIEMSRIDYIKKLQKHSDYDSP